ncbi:MAG: TIGR02285 family protein [Thermodesulfobacteriota bacterium]
MKKLLFSLTAIAFLIGPNAWAKDRISWLVIHYPPFEVLRGPDKGQGRFDLLIDLYIKNLPQYEHEKVEMNWARFWTGIREGKHIINPFSIRTEERTHYALFSQPNIFGLPVEVAMKKSALEKLGNPASISLRGLLYDKWLKGIRESKRSYGQVLDEIMQSRGAESNMEGAPISADSIVRMILSGRADYTIEYAFITRYLAARLAGEYPEPIVCLPIEEAPPFQETSVACPRNEWGEKVIRDIDAMLDKLKKDPGYLRILQVGYNEKESKIIRDNYESYFLNLE